MARHSAIRDLRRAMTMAVTILLLLPTIAFAQSPWERGAASLERVFNIIARPIAVIAVILAGVTMMYGEGGAKKQFAGVLFGGGIALFAAEFLLWLF